MVEFEKFFLDNGLTVIFHRDTTTPIAALNIIYKVGSRDENPGKTGFAHLFEHLMFEGSKSCKEFDKIIEKAGGSSNAFTNFDFTNYFIMIPKDNIEIALWLEAGRMMELDFNPEKLNIQKQVVIEEYKETLLNRPYGDDYKLMLELAYKVHPYQWPVIGKDFSHIQKATLDDVKKFFYSYYAPNNAILAIGGDFDTDQIKEMINKYFGNIPARDVPVKKYPIEPTQTSPRQKTVERDVPFDEIMLAFHYFPRTNFGYYVANVITDILANGPSSRFYQKLVKEKQLFSDIDAYISDTLDTGLLFIEGVLNEGINPQTGLQAIWEELELLKSKPVQQRELDKIINSIETKMIDNRTNVVRKTMSLAYFEMLGDANLYNVEELRYRNISAQDILTYANIIFQPHRANLLYYLAKK